MREKQHSKHHRAVINLRHSYNVCVCVCLNNSKIFSRYKPRTSEIVFKWRWRAAAGYFVACVRVLKYTCFIFSSASSWYIQVHVLIIYTRKLLRRDPDECAIYARQLIVGSPLVVANFFLLFRGYIVRRTWHGVPYGFA